MYLKVRLFTIATDHVILRYKKGLLLTLADSLRCMYGSTTNRRDSEQTTETTTTTADKNDGNHEPTTLQLNRLITERQNTGICLNFVYSNDDDSVPAVQQESATFLPTLDVVRNGLSGCPDFCQMLQHLSTGWLPPQDDAARRLIL